MEATINKRKLRRHRSLSWLCGMTLIFSNAVLCQSPEILVPPASQAVPEGGTAYLSVSAAGALPITYTWRRNFEFTNYYSATLDSSNCTLVLTNLTPDKACFFYFGTSNAFGRGGGGQVIVAVMAAGMQTNGFALTIFGLTNSVWRIDCTTNVGEADWFTLTNLNIPRTPSWTRFVDLAATNLNRYYRVVPTVF